MSQTRQGIPDSPGNAPEYVVYDIDGVGEMEFPTTMSKLEMDAQAKRLYEQAKTDARPINLTNPNDIRDIAIGTAKGAGRAAVGLGEGLNYLTKMRPQLPTQPGAHVFQPTGTGISEAIAGPGVFDYLKGQLAPTNPAQKVGRFGADAGTAAAVMAGTAGTVQPWPLVLRLAAQAGLGAGVSAAQGHSPVEGAVTGAAAEAIPAALQVGGRELASRMILKPKDAVLGMIPGAGSRAAKSSAIAEDALKRRFLSTGTESGARKAADAMDALAAQARNAVGRRRVDLQRVIPGPYGSGLDRAYGQIVKPEDIAAGKEVVEGFKSHPRIYHDPVDGVSANKLIKLGQEYERSAVGQNTPGAIVSRGLASNARTGAAAGSRAAPIVADMERLAPTAEALAQVEEPTLHGVIPHSMTGAFLNFAVKRALPSVAHGAYRTGAQLARPTAKALIMEYLLGRQGDDASPALGGDKE